MNYYHFAVLKKNDDYLAVITNQRTSWELGHFNEQGYVLFMYVQAFNANSAIEIAKQNSESEVGRLQAELNALSQEHQRLLNEYNRLKFNSAYGQNQIDNIDPLVVLGFSQMPNKKDLKKRYKSLVHKTHPDNDGGKGGSEFLFKIITSAHEKLEQLAV